MADEMFFTKGDKALRRGSRIHPRTDTCRPCLVRLRSAPSMELEGVVMDINPKGMRVRMIEALPVGTEISIQLMRDDAFKVPFSVAHNAVVVRHIPGAAGFTDHGFKLQLSPVKKLTWKAPKQAARGPAHRAERPRMHTIDVRVGGPIRGRKTR